MGSHFLYLELSLYANKASFIFWLSDWQMVESTLIKLPRSRMQSFYCCYVIAAYNSPSSETLPNLDFANYFGENVFIYQCNL